MIHGDRSEPRVCPSRVTALGTAAAFGRVAIAVTMAVAAGPGATSATASDGLTLDEANRRWRGARCRTRMEISVKKGSNSDGWAKSRPLFWSERGGNERVTLLFSNADALRRSFRRGTLPIGTELIVVGWGAEEGSGNLYLELEVAGLPSRARLFFWDDWVGKVSPKRLPQFERWTRFELLELTSVPEEQLVEVADTAADEGLGPPPPRPEVPAATAQEPNLAVGPGLHVVAVTVEPVRVAPGHEVRLIVVYGVEGVPPGMALAVTERRSIVGSGQALTSVEAVAHRENGLHQSSQPLRIPADLTEGVYELRATVAAVGSSAQGSAIFEVTSHAN